MTRYEENASCRTTVLISHSIMQTTLVKVTLSLTAVNVQEVCRLETMEGRCRWNSEVMVMTSARWGRMKTGRCLGEQSSLLALHQDDPRFLGCYEDVLSVLDRKCSGHSQCDVRVPTADLDHIKPCYPELERYLEVSYACVKGMTDSNSQQKYIH